MCKWFKRLFCKHEYENKRVYTLIYDVDIKECVKCEKRIEINRIPRNYDFDIEDCRIKNWNIQ